MEIFLQVSLAFPTVIFSFLLCLAVLYWVIVAFGLIEIDVLDVEADSALEGPAAALLSKLKLRDIPLTLVFTLLAFFAWFISYFADLWLLSLLPLEWLRYPLGVVIALLALMLAVAPTRLLCAPLRPLFRKLEVTSSKSVLGQTAVVRSGRVTASHGEAVLEDGGAGLILRVRADEQLGFTRGDRVVLLEYLEAQHAYRVITEDEFRGI